MHGEISASRWFCYKNISRCTVKLVLLVGFVIRIYHDARSSEYQSVMSALHAVSLRLGKKATYGNERALWTVFNYSYRRDTYSRSHHTAILYISSLYYGWNKTDINLDVLQ